MGLFIFVSSSVQKLEPINSIFWDFPKKWKNYMKIKKNTFSTLVLELFFPSIANCMKL
jgi:hypothetical protein